MIILICGVPGSGKSTIAGLLAQRTGATLLSTEKFRRKVYHRLMKELERTESEKIILDGTFYRREWRESVKEFAKRKGIPLLVVWVKSSLQTSLQRDAKRETPIGERAVKIIHAEFEKPEADVVIDSEKLTPEEAVEIILSATRREVGMNQSPS
jgi:predicted kinase